MKRAAFGDYVVSGPYAHDNLALYLVHGEDRMPGKAFLTLGEALEKGLAVVHETEDVNELAIENVSKEFEIFVQSGDIVKGGKQDRVIGTDFIVQTNSDRMPIASVCVESGRWQRRGDEASGNFSGGSTYRVPGKALKLSSNVGYSGSGQQAVWREVASNQGKLNDNVGYISGNVRYAANAAESPSSMQLTLETKDLREVTEKYRTALAGIIEGKNDVVGFAFAINGEPNSADVYASPTLLRKLWSKLLDAAIVEAIAEIKKDQEVSHPATAKLVVEFFGKLEEEGQKVEVSEKNVSKRIGIRTKDSEKVILLETFDKEHSAPAEAIHSSWVAH
jgi:hypothetical protein